MILVSIGIRSYYNLNNDPKVESCLGKVEKNLPITFLNLCKANSSTLEFKIDQGLALK